MPEVTDRAERALVGAMLLNPKRAAPMLMDTMEPERISDSLVQKIYRLAIDLFCRHGYVDETPLIYAISQDVEGGAQDNATVDVCKKYLQGCRDEIKSIDALSSYIKIVNDSYKAAQFTDICSRFMYGNTYSTADIDVVMEETASSISNLLSNTQHGGLVGMEDIAVKLYQRLFDKASLKDNIRTGFSRLDHITRLFRKKQLIVLAARPRVGKSAMALNWTLPMAKQGKRVALFSLEMSKEELHERYMAHMTRTSINVIQDRDFGDTTAEKLANAAGEISKLPMCWDDDSAMSVDQIRMQAKLKRADIVIVDYLQLIRPTGRNSSRNEEVGRISRSLKEMAMELDIPVVALSQLNRKNDEDQEPSLRDLRDSGSIEQDANMVLMLWECGIEPVTNEKYIACKVAKNRNGPNGEVVFEYRGSIMTFEETDRKVPRDAKGKTRKRLRPWDAKFQEVGDQQIF